MSTDPMEQSEENPAPLPAGVRLGRAICNELPSAERREWWLSNGRGAYAAGTVAGTLTRRYHGLLVAPTDPPLGRTLMLAKADAALVDGDRSWPLFTNRWASGAIEPAGLVHIESFRLDGRLPVWTFAIGPIRIEQRVWLTPGRDQVHSAWRLLPGISGDPRPRELRLRVALLVAGRDHHHVKGLDAETPHAAFDGSSISVRWTGRPPLRLHATGGELIIDPLWIEDFDLPLERERGLEDRDRHWRVGHAELVLRPDGAWVGISAATNETATVGEGAGLGLAEALRVQRQREQALLAQASDHAAPCQDTPDWVQQLVLAADSFLFSRVLPDTDGGLSVIAGYPWFGDWGRDTMIALPGLCLATGRDDEARRILRTFARFIADGLLPNLFPGSGGTAAYHSVDAPLWYIQAWRSWVEAVEDDETLSEIMPALASIIAAYREGTRFGIRMDPADGLITAGARGLQLTWMDAKAGDWVVTPRAGKPVEINALWYNALDGMQQFSQRLGADPAPYAELAEQTRQGFQRYRRGDGGGLLDVLDGQHGNDPAVRPNQVFAVSLPASPLSPSAQAGVLGEIAKHLLTSHGLRSLSPADPSYRGSYAGDIDARDGAYHQGTVWAWLLGHYAIAEHRVTGDARLALSRLEPLGDHLLDAGLGSISEIFDGDAPHRPCGAPCQAWSVACSLEAWWRLGGTLQR